MLLEFRQVHAGVAVHAVAGVNPQAMSPPTQVAEGAVVYAAPLLIIPQAADAAVVLAQPRVTLSALSCKRESSSVTCLLHETQWLIPSPWTHWQIP